MLEVLYCSQLGGVEDAMSILTQKVPTGRCSEMCALKAQQTVPNSLGACDSLISCGLVVYCAAVTRKSRCFAHFPSARNPIQPPQSDKKRTLCFTRDALTSCLELVEAFCRRMHQLRMVVKQSTFWPLQNPVPEGLRNAIDS